MNEKTGLLDEISKGTGSLYISDLHGNLMGEGVMSAIDGIQRAKYSDKEWREAYTYISYERISTGTEEEIRAQFKKDFQSRSL